MNGRVLPFSFNTALELMGKVLELSPSPCVIGKDQMESMLKMLDYLSLTVLLLLSERTAGGYVKI